MEIPRIDKIYELRLRHRMRQEMGPFPIMVGMDNSITDMDGIMIERTLNDLGAFQKPDKRSSARQRRLMERENDRLLCMVMEVFCKTFGEFEEC